MAAGRNQCDIFVLYGHEFDKNVITVYLPVSDPLFRLTQKLELLIMKQIFFQKVDEHREG